MPKQDEHAIEAVAQRFVEAWNRHDPTGLAALFANDADFVNVIGMWWKSRAEIEAVMARNHAMLFRESHLEPTGLWMRFIRPDVAVVHATWELTGERSTYERPLPPRRGLVTYTMSKENDGWTIAAFQNTDIVAPPTVRTGP